MRNLTVKIHEIEPSRQAYSAHNSILINVFTSSLPLPPPNLYMFFCCETVEPTLTPIKSSIYISTSHGNTK